MTTRALIMNFGKEEPKCELQGRKIDGTFQQVDERELGASAFIPFTLFKLQHLLVIGPATVCVANDGHGARLKVETQSRDERGRFQQELHAQIIEPGTHCIFSISKGQQLQVHERAAT